jgi:hypothetical protein
MSSGNIILMIDFSNMSSGSTRWISSSSSYMRDNNTCRPD